MKIKILPLAIAASLCASFAMADGASNAPAMAMPAPPRPASPFDGAWAGVSFGKGYTSLGVTAGVGLQEGTSVPFAGDLISLAYPDSGASGSTFGIEAGYGRSFGDGWYWGGQLDHLITDLDANANMKLTIVNPAFGENRFPASGEVDLGYHVNVRSMTSATGRIGYQINDKSMLYGLGGISIARATASLEGFNPTGKSNSFVAAGLTLGMGIETLVRGNTSLKLEYRTTNFGDQTISSIDSPFAVVPVNFHASVATRADTIRVALVHRF